MPECRVRKRHRNLSLIEMETQEDPMEISLQMTEEAMEYLINSNVKLGENKISRVKTFTASFSDLTRSEVKYIMKNFPSNE
ncbi:hypothetical protein Glove_69g68 [Diversispora epigaea]|uniref:Uncharacterized protein n=1 Tax=Diversispora epigaea TaxID=1348612 RepID=A0A397JDL1_9GLOM|nr:hypothetical protein Glove_69g68 [Diversispora epigaea]